ncbi:MAG: UDP-N-acetylmuramate dehydrogenase [Firmicutes bacterium]|nr:UDP-N-acetylmuramate dehydrogenase [Bacillota bacterium]
MPTLRLLMDEPMSAHTSFRVGGPADIMLLPATVAETTQALQLLKEQDVPVYVMGNGSNLLVRDGGIRGVVIKVGDNLSKASVDGVWLRAQAGISLARLAHIAWQAGLSGLEFASGIPGSLGGAVAMNAGAYGGEMKDVIRRVTACDLTGRISVMDLEELKLGYRTSKVKQDRYIALEALLQLQIGDKDTIKVIMADLNKRRREKQPLSFASAGSTFKRPPGYYAGKLIEDAGLRGASIGDAQVSELHCGFVINRGQATAGEILKLIELVKDTVWNKFKVELELEVQVVGED